MSYNLLECQIACAIRIITMYFQNKRFIKLILWVLWFRGVVELFQINVSEQMYTPMNDLVVLYENSSVARINATTS